LPIGTPSISVSNSATIEAESGATYHPQLVPLSSGISVPALDPDSRTSYLAQLVTNALRFYPTGASFFARFTPDARFVATSGVSYFARIDYISTPDFTVIPEPGGADVIFGTSGFTIQGGDTAYITSALDTSYAAVAVPMPACTMTELYIYCGAGPGTGKTFQYDVLKNSIAQNLTVTISGTSQSGTLTGQVVTFAAGDMFALRVITSAGSATTNHSYSIKIS
jgi:hypothetical protein